MKTDRLLYGVAYYDEYLPVDRIETDMEMIKKAGMNVIRIAESTWSTWEPQDGVFDFTHLHRMLSCSKKHGIQVIVGTPTYAVPTWLARKYPDIITETHDGPGRYGHRQNMDIAHPMYLKHAERIIRRLMEEVQSYDHVIGFQLDNETKSYDTCSVYAQKKFVDYVRTLFHDDLSLLNQAWGLDYWSNRINAWEDFPDVRGTINASLGEEYQKFQRKLVSDFLAWQSAIVQEYARPDQFITQNFDYDWRGYSFGMQPEVDQWDAAKTLTVAGCDIYHPSAQDLTGKEIAFGGAIARSLKKDNYLVPETEAQGNHGWLSYPGQLRLQAFSHLANGAGCVEYWHWHSIHNACETYWKGILSHDFAKNAVYREVCRIGGEFDRLGSRLIHLKKENKAAILVSNEALTAMKWFPLPGEEGAGVGYNGVVRWIYDALYEQNMECDFISTEETDLSGYRILFVPALYSASRECLERIQDFAAAGGTLIATFKTAFTDENVKVWPDVQPHLLGECFGIHYHEFTVPVSCGLVGDGFSVEEEDRKARVFMELLETDGAQVIASYDHYAWKHYAAITDHAYGKGRCIYLGCMTSPAYLKALLASIWEQSGLRTWKQDCAFPLIVREGRNQSGRRITYLLNYSGEIQHCTCAEGGTELFAGRKVEAGDTLEIAPWDLLILEEEG